MIKQTKLDRLKSAMPGKNNLGVDSESEQSDPEIKRLKRKAGI
jgi:hypothetical protein